LSQRNSLRVVREDGFAHGGNGHIEYVTPRIDVTGIAKPFSVPFIDTLQSLFAHTLAIPLVKQRFNRFAVKINQPVIRLVFAHARQTALFNNISVAQSHIESPVSTFTACSLKRPISGKA
jgi:hypothetical protein